MKPNFKSIPKPSKITAYLNGGRMDSKSHRFKIASSTIEVDGKPRAVSNMGLHNDKNSGRYNDKNMSLINN
jgi:hypothetical protein